MSAPTLLLIDGNAILHRAFHALPPLTAPDGRVVNACYGFFSLFFKALLELRPTHIAVVFDRPEPTFRQQLFPAYQAQREKQPDDLYAQIPMVKEILGELRIPVYEAAGFEADDVIGTIIEKVGSRTSEVGGHSTVILTGDKDLLQLVREGVKVILLRRGMTDTARYDAAAIIERFGFPPERIPDYKALAGDPSDNYPGVPGVGEKTATELVIEFGGVAEILQAAQAEELPIKMSAKLAQKLRDHAANAALGLKLATIIRNAPVAFDLDDCARRTYNREAVIAKFRALGFTSLLGRLPDQQKSTGGVQEPEDTVIHIPSNSGDAREIFKQAKTLALALIADDDGQPTALGISGEDRAAGWLWDEAVRICASTLRDVAIAKDAHGIKTIFHALRPSGVALKGIRYDTEILSYLLAPGSRSHDLAHAAFTELGFELKNEGIEIERAAREAAIVRRLTAVLVKKIEDADLMRVYEQFERPLIHVLSRMEEFGIRLDAEQLERLGKKMRRELDRADCAIFELSGEAFNIDSPLQLKRILFEKIGIAARGIKKTAKGGGLSTAAPELEKLRDVHPIIGYIFTHRELQKLLSTYVESLPKIVNSKTGRIHTTFHQTVTATGRLSSSDPNLQNIPASEPWGPEIRKAFITEDGWRLLALDYSQFELRIAAALSGDETLLKAFRNGADIHAATGAEVFGVSPEEVTRDQRRVAKAINFGILYGMGASVLAQSANISRPEAEEYISRYFQAYDGLRDWIETIKALAYSRGYVETMFGRKRFLPEIKSNVPQVRAAAERMAVNMPVQGTQADLLKLAMIRADKWIQDSCANRARMILTVHDELVFEVREDFVAEAARSLKEILENVHKLPVPIIVEAREGKNWGEMERV